MFSSRYRGAKIAGLSAVVLAICLYAALAGPSHMRTFYQFAEEPLRYDGQPLNFSIEKVLEIEGPDILLRSGATIARLRVPGGPPPGISRGTWISARGVYRAGGWVDVQGGVHVHELRKDKQWLSTIGMLVLLGWFFASYRWDRGRRVLVERVRCRT